MGRERHRGTPGANALKRPITHNALKSQILEYLTLRGWLAWSNNTGAFPVEDEQHARRFVRFGRKGSADIFALRPSDGRFYSIEVKVGGDKLRPEQQQWLEEVRAHGGVAIVARDLVEVVALVDPAVRKAVE